MGYLKTQSGVVKQTVPQESAKGKIKGDYCHTDDMDDIARVYEGGARLLTSRRGGDPERPRTDPFGSLRTLAGRTGVPGMTWLRRQRYQVPLFVDLGCCHMYLHLLPCDC